eukprot:942018-Pleurochrysis_carterae.AAC.2
MQSVAGKPTSARTHATRNGKLKLSVVGDAIPYYEVTHARERHALYAVQRHHAPAFPLELEDFRVERRHFDQAPVRCAGVYPAAHPRL